MEILKQYKMTYFLDRSATQVLLLSSFFLLFFSSWSNAINCDPNSNLSIKTFGDKRYGKIEIVYTASDTIVMAPVIKERKIVLRTQSGLEVFDLEMDKKLWSYQVPGRIIRKPFIEGKTVYLAKDKDYLTALNFVTGKILWEKKLGLITLDFEPVVCSGKVYLTTTRRVYALNAQSGEVIWSVDGGPFGTNPIAKDDKILVFNRGNNTILQINKESGQVLAEQKLKYIDYGPKVIDGNRLYYYGFKILTPKDVREAIICLNIDEGNIAWEIPFDDQFYIVNNRLYLSKDNIYLIKRLRDKTAIHKTLLCKLNPNSGETLWEAEYEGIKTDKVDLAFQGDLTFFSDPNHMYCVSTDTGHVIFSIEGNNFSPCATDSISIFWGNKNTLLSLQQYKNSRN
jgi:outer membrane protein assembly factor BamB